MINSSINRHIQNESFFAFYTNEDTIIIGQYVILNQSEAACINEFHPIKNQAPNNDVLMAVFSCNSLATLYVKQNQSKFIDYGLIVELSKHDVFVGKKTKTYQNGKTFSLETGQLITLGLSDNHTLLKGKQITYPSPTEYHINLKNTELLEKRYKVEQINEYTLKRLKSEHQLIAFNKTTYLTSHSKTPIKTIYNLQLELDSSLTFTFYDPKKAPWKKTKSQFVCELYSSSIDAMILVRFDKKRTYISLKKNLQENHSEQIILNKDKTWSLRHFFYLNNPDIPTNETILYLLNFYASFENHRLVSPMKKKEQSQRTINQEENDSFSKVL